MDQERDRGGVALMIPDNLAGACRDRTGRRILTRIPPRTKPFPYCAESPSFLFTQEIQRGDNEQGDSNGRRIHIIILIHAIPGLDCGLPRRRTGRTPMPKACGAASKEPFGPPPGEIRAIPRVRGVTPRWRPVTAGTGYRIHREEEGHVSSRSNRTRDLPPQSGGLPAPGACAPSVPPVSRVYSEGFGGGTPVAPDGSRTKREASNRGERGCALPR